MKLHSTESSVQLAFKIPGIRYLERRREILCCFEAKCGLYQLTRLPFGVTNGVACFHRKIIRFVKNNQLKAVFPYLDNITIFGKSQSDHDAYLGLFWRLLG